MVMVCMSRTREEISTQAAQKGRPARPQAEQEPEAYPLGYVEDSCELRTPLAAFFSILLLRKCELSELSLLDPLLH